MTGLIPARVSIASARRTVCWFTVKTSFLFTQNRVVQCQPMQYVLGIDAGGTKTHLALADENGRVLAQAKAGEANLHSVRPADIVAHLKAGWKQLARQARLPASARVHACVVGFAGLDSKADLALAQRVIAQAFGGILNGAKVRLVNDTVVGFRSGSKSGVGMCVIGGTGSNCYGRNARGREALAGGLGHILADEGSGYDIGLRALMAAAKAADGRGPKTKLLALVLKRYRVKSIRDLMPVVYAPSYGKQDIAQLAYDVQAAAASGDKVAKEVSKGAGAELALLATTVGKKLFKTTEAFDVVMIGGVLQHDPLVLAEFKKRVRRAFPKAKFIIPKQDPVMGAVAMALRS